MLTLKEQWMTKGARVKIKGEPATIKAIHESTIGKQFCYSTQELEPLHN